MNAKGPVMISIVRLSVVSFFLSLSPVAMADGAPRQVLPDGKAGAVNIEPAVDPKVREVLKAAADGLTGAKSLSLVLDMTLNIQMQGMKQEMPSSYTLAVQRPNRVALVLKEGMFGATVVSDGTKLFTYLPMLKRYTEGPAPTNLVAVLSGTGGEGLMDAMGGGSCLGAFFAQDPVKELLDGVTNALYVGKEKRGEVECHHMRFFQKEMDWELWVQVGERALVQSVTVDLGRTFEKTMGEVEEVRSGTGEMLKNMKMTVSVVFKEWQFNPELPAGCFTFTPPEGAKKGGTSEGGDDEEEPSPLVGQPAPAFTLERLGGGTVDSATEKGQHVVVLDFWATWCGPCVKALPLVAEVAETYRPKGVVFYAVNQREKPEDIERFLKNKGLSVAVALDKDAAVGKSFGVKGIPQTVIIDKAGVVQAVHVGYSEGLKERLSKQLDEVLAGRSPATAGPAAQRAPAELKGLSQIAVVPGSWSGVAAGSDSGLAYAVSGEGTLGAVTAQGKLERSSKIGSAGSSLRLANLIGGKEKEFVRFRAWGEAVKACDAAGRPLWDYSGGQGVDDVCAADINGDGFDEVIIGYNGSSGVHVLDNQGRVLWSYDKIANVWHVCAGDLEGDGSVEVVTTSASGAVHVFDAEGKKLRELDPEGYASVVCLAPPAAGDKQMTIIVDAQSQEECALVGLDLGGKQKWRTSMASGRGAHIDVAHVAKGKPWAAVAVRGASVKVVDCSTGAVIGEVPMTKGRFADVAWLEAEGGPVLLVANGKGLVLYRVDVAP